MGFFRKMFGQGGADRDTGTIEPPAATPHRVGYDPKLIDALLSDHARLGAMFERIGNSSKTGDYDEVRKLLAHFKSSLQAHILTENVRFYTYVESLTADDPDNARIMHGFRRDMNAIARKVVNFIKTYQACDFASRTEREQFAKDYATVGGLLEQRLDSEENDLYPLYVAT
ncbi:MAG TPA: hemerythrin domain-containing protein [Rhodanobacteraceae bacterium]|nr:hemerythrin domain-containing protein [Rhodanobacteraceae bacterium]